ncbi:MAG: hypothetical protein EBY81_03150, partial [Verrucomicrobia bacterium]|nr:hypothetical protein [Verrucomicrobiota bacterium]
ALPWWLLFRAAGAAFSPTVILLAALGALATWAGWSLADRMQLAGVEQVTDVIAAAGVGQQSTVDGLVLPSGSGGLPGGRLLAPSRSVMPGLLGLLGRHPALLQTCRQNIIVIRGAHFVLPKASPASSGRSIATNSFLCLAHDSVDNFPL